MSKLRRFLAANDGTLSVELPLIAAFSAVMILVVRHQVMDVIKPHLVILIHAFGGHNCHWPHVR